MMDQGAPRVVRGEKELDQYAKALFDLTAKTKPTRAEFLAVELLTIGRGV